VLVSVGMNFSTSGITISGNTLGMPTGAETAARMGVCCGVSLAPGYPGTTTLGLSNITITRNTIAVQNNGLVPEAAVGMSETGSTSGITDLTIANNACSYSTLAGYAENQPMGVAWTSNASGIAVSGNTFTGFINGGILLQPGTFAANAGNTCTNVGISGNTFENCATKTNAIIELTGLSTETSAVVEHVTISGNTITSAAAIGIELQSANDVTITGNTITGVTTPTKFLTGVTGVTVDGQAAA
jgi:parallel beta-helix repeat protein